MRIAGAALILVAVLFANAAPGAWVVDEQGSCVERWQAADLLRGPTAIANVPLLPLRTMAGGAVYAWRTDEWWPGQIIFLGPAVTLLCGAAGIIEGVWWAGTGLADTFTGGSFAIAPEEATRLSIAPDLPVIIADAAATPTPTTDHCGRPVAAAK